MKNLGMAYAMKKRSKKKMADGGMVENEELQMDRRDPETSFAKEQGDQMPEQNEEDDNSQMFANGGEVEEHYESIADAILAKKRKANKPMEASNEFFMNQDEMAADNYDAQEMDEAPKSESPAEDLISSIMRKRKKRA